MCLQIKKVVNRKKMNCLVLFKYLLRATNILTSWFTGDEQQNGTTGFLVICVLQN